MIAKFSVKKPYTVLVAVVMVIVLGVVSFTRMSADLLPNINLPYVIIMTTYVGASPETVEMTVTKPVESAMATVSNIENISSVSNENYSMVILEFAQSANMDSVSLEIRETLDQIESYWDDSVGNPIIMKLNPDMLPVMVAAVGGKGMTNAQISELANDKIIPQLESIEGVASANATGLIEENVQVIIRQEKIDAINEQVFGAIDEKMADAQKELNDGKKDLADSEKEIADNLADLEEAKQEIADGKQELADKEAEIADGKEELEDKKEETTKKLSEAMTGLLTAKSTISTLNVNITTLETTIVATMSAVSPGVKTVEDAKNAYGKLTRYAGITTIYSNDEKDDIEETFSGIVASLISGMSMPEGTLLKDIPGDPSDPSASGPISTAINAMISATKGGIDANINIPTKIMEYEGYVTAKQQIYDALNKSPDMKISSDKELDDAIAKLTQGQMEAAAGFGSAEATIQFGEAQIESVKKQLEASEDQITTGREQIDSAKEQIDDAKEQIKDAQEQLDDSKTQAYNSADMNGILTIDNVKGLLAAQNFSMPGGYITEDGIEYLVRIGDKPKDVATLSKMPIMNVNMDGVDVITLSDVADVFMTDNTDEIYTNINGAPGVLLQIQKQTGYSTGDVSEKINDKFNEFIQEDSNLMLIPLMDQGIYIDLVMNSIINNILWGALLAIIILILFLKDLRPTFVIAVSIPISIVTAIVCMYFSGVTLNIISLSGLALGIGMLVDNSIVVIENIYRMRNEGVSIREASIEGAREVAGAITASTLTTICVFLPIVFTEGITRQLFVDMGLTIAYSLVSSLAIALTVVPAMASKILTKTKEKKSSVFYNKMLSGYEKLLHLAIRFKVVVLIGVVILLGVSVALAVTNGTAFMPQMDSTQITATLTPEEGMSLKEAGILSDKLMEKIRQIDDVKDVGAMAGGSDAQMLSGGGSDSSNQIQMYITLKEDKGTTAKEIGDEILASAADMKNIELAVQTETMDMSALGGSGITVQVRGRDIDRLQSIAKDVAKIVENTEGTCDVSDGIEDTTGELRITINRDRAMEYGLTVAQVFSQINSKIKEQTSNTELTTDTKDYAIYVHNKEHDSITREEMKHIFIEYTDEDKLKQEVELSEIATFENKEGLKSINREEQNRYIAVTASIADGYNIGIVSNELNKKLEDYQLPSGYILHFSGENEMINDALKQVLLMLLLAIIFMYLIMVAQFQSLLSPFIIMFTIPLAFTGGLLGLYVTGSEISVIALIGFVMLSGVIVNNGIVMVDYINQLREQGMNKEKAIITAGCTRLRPVLMTALTTILALSTMVFSKEMGADMSKPMAVVTIGGMLYGTLLTLFVIPCVYDVFHKDKSVN